MLAGRQAPAQIARVDYHDHRLRVRRTARWGSIGTLGPATTRVWIVLHGYGQLAASFAGSAHWPLAPHRAFVFPEALQRFYEPLSRKPGNHADAPVGASWMTREAREDDIADNLDYLDALAGVISERAPNAAPVAVIAFSQGTATATRWAERRIRADDVPPDLVLCGGLLPPDADVGPEGPLRRTRVTLVVGTLDRWLTAERLQEERARLAAAAFPVRVHQFEGGHRLDDTFLRTLADDADGR